MITHSVFFRLIHAEGSAEESAFLASAQALADLPMVRNLRCVRQTSPKNGFRYGLLMEFADSDAYDAYNDHPQHRHFVEQRWLSEVEDFLEIDYATM